MSFEDLCRSYLDSLAQHIETAERTGAATGELSFRTPLDNFFSEVCSYFGPGIDKIHEPANEGNTGRPDWRFSNEKHQGVYGYVEGKALDLDDEIDVVSNRKQVEKYLSLGQDVILTDGLDFGLWKPGDESPNIISLVNKPVNPASLADQELDPRLETQLRDFFEQAAARKCNEEELVRQAALRANQISKGVRDLVRLEPEEAIDTDEKSTIETLQALRVILEEHHDPTMRSPDIFASFIAQVLIFGLLYTHRVEASEDRLPTETYEYLHGFWSENGYGAAGQLRPFKALVDLLDKELKEGKLGDVGTWYDDFRHYLAYVELESSQREDLDYHKLYEQFLEEFDSEQRWEYGAFYTPPSLVDFVVNLVDAIASTHLEHVTLFSAENKLVDPCCGTGSFLEALARKAPDQHDAEIAGFEVLPAPYALSHYRMSMISEDGKYPSGVSIVLTNTLLDQLATEPEATPDNMVQREQLEAWRLSRPPLLLIIGNPPSKSSSLDDRTSGDHFSIIERQLDDFRPPEDDRTARSNTQKQVRNTFMKFLRWACEKIEQSPRGILAFVLPSSFSNGESYRYARKWLLEQFSMLWVVDLDRDGRTGKRNYSLFGTRQGRTLVVGLHASADIESNSDEGQETSLAKTFYATLFELDEQRKLEFLTADRNQEEYLTLFESHSTTSPYYELRPGTPFPEDLWISYWPLKPADTESSVFERHCSAVKCAPTHMVVHADKNLLKRRTRDLANTEKSFSELKSSWFDGMDRPPNQKKRTEAVIDALENACNDWNNSTKEFSYRPFLSCHAVLTRELMEALKDTPGGGARDRPELRSAFQSEDTVGLGIANSPSRLGDSLHRFAAFCWNLPDNDLIYRGSARILCNQYPEIKEGEDWNSTPFNNIGSELLERLDSAYERDVSSSDIVYYVYAVLSSNSYLSKFEGALFRSGINPRVPFPEDEALFEEVRCIGAKLAELEKDDESDLGEYDKYVDLFDSSFKLHHPRWYNWCQEIETDEEVLNLSDAYVSKTRIELQNRESRDAEVVIDGIRPEVTNFEIAGNKPVYEWLKLHSFPFIRRNFKSDDFKEFLSLLNRIERQIDLLDEVDETMKRLTSTNIELIDPEEGQSNLSSTA